MRFIDPAEIEVSLPAQWTVIVTTALRYVAEKVSECKQECLTKALSPVETEKAVAKARSRAINDKSSVWSEAGSHFRKLSDDKCWYCEAHETRSDMPVDHFRPKNSVAECNGDHCGYWWLAFEWSNYRFSCTYCNSRRVDVQTAGGKQDHFPLLNPTERAMCESDPLDRELPILLDPCDIDDIFLITFNELGQPTEACQDQSLTDFKRASQSIHLYHLDHIKIVRERRKIAIDIRRLVDRIEKLMALGTVAHTERKERVKELAALIGKKSEFCSAARVYLKAHTHRLPLIEHLLLRTL